MGVRIPNHDFVRSLMTRLDDIPLAQTSANISSIRNNPVCIEVIEVCTVTVFILIISTAVMVSYFAYCNSL